MIAHYNSIIENSGHEELKYLDYLLTQIYNDQQEFLFKVLSGHHSEMDVSTHLNVLKEVYNSNEAMLRSTQSYLEID